jgi:hypothetical protein
MKPGTEKKSFYRLLLVMCSLVGIFSSFNLMAQRNKEKLQDMINKDRATIDAIAGYDENVQQDILQLAQSPEVLNILEDLQKKSERQFRDIIQEYDRDGQAALYEMARYPDLISELVQSGKPSSSRVNDIVSKYPADIHETVKKYARSYYDALREIDQLNNETDRQFQSYLSPYDEQTRASVRTLLKYPEIVSILVEDKEFTKILGLTYQEDPDWVINQLDTISAELEEENQKDLADYKNQMQNDPEAYQEMLSAADKFSAESNMTRDYGDNYPGSGSLEINIIHSYPYWYGYPYWYPYPYWRPYPVYYHTGFYIGSNRSVVFVGLPSSHFIYWQTHYHPTLYPHLSYSYYNYYHNHFLPYRDQRRPISHYGFYHSVERNVINNPRVNNDNLLRIDRKRGSNIVRQPSTFSGSNDSYFGRRPSTISGYDAANRRSVKRDAFPRTTPSTVRTSEGSNSRSPASRDNSTNVIRDNPTNGGRSIIRDNPGTRESSVNRDNSPGANTRQGQSSTPSFNSGAEKSAPSQSQNRQERYLDAGKRNTFQQGSPQDRTLRNYRNYTATEPRQVIPSSGREPVQRISPNAGSRNQSGSRSGRTSEGHGNSREK